MALKYELRVLSEEFYNRYPHEKYPELEFKQKRPFLVFLIRIENNTFAIPFRTNVRHNYCYKFKKSGRFTTTQTALDYSKAVVVNNSSMLGKTVMIDI